MPFQYMGKRSSGKLAVDNAIYDVDCDLILAIDRMVMRWIMIAIEDGNSDPKEAADNRHL